MSEHSIDLSLVSHTNQGKTTLLRTLLRRDVGEVFDKAHVTDENTPYVLLEAGDAQLVLWDTPGFGDSARLLKRLRAQENPLGWLVAQVWDRFADRSLWCGQQAVINVRDEADLVLYLVNASETPESAGYLEPEIAILEWIDRPVVVLLNQTGPPRGAAAESAELDAWRRWAEKHPIVRDVLVLDAFTRCWIQEGVLLEHIGPLLPDALRPSFEVLTEAWYARNLASFEHSVDALTGYLAAVCADRVVLPRNDRTQRKLAGEELRGHVRRATRELTQELIDLFDLAGRSSTEIEEHIEDLDVRGKVLDERKAAALGGVVGGLFGGLAADFLAGGLTFGGGAVAGALTGLLGSAGLVRTQKILKSGQQPAVTWTTDFLVRLAGEALVFYLAVAHYGRGRGEFRDLEEPRHWKEAVDTALTNRKNALGALAEELRDAGSDASGEAARARLRKLVRHALEDVLADLYPQDAAWVRNASRSVRP